MTETEKRRLALLEQTRKTYSEKYAPPAVHPRYKGVYRSIYLNEDVTKQAEEKNTFVIRLMIATLLFGVFVVASHYRVAGVEKVVAEIQQELGGLVDLNVFR